MDRNADLLLLLLNDAVTGPIPNLRRPLSRRRLHALTLHEQRLLRVALETNDPVLKQAALETSARLMDYLSRSLDRRGLFDGTIPRRRPVDCMNFGGERSPALPLLRFWTALFLKALRVHR
jgi:hypothetical protein